MLSNQELLKMWKEDMMFKRMADTTISANVTGLEKFFEAVDNKPAGEVTRRILDGYIYGLTKLNGEPMNVATKAKEQSHLRNFFNWLYDSDEPEIEEMLVYYDQNGRERDRKNPTENWKSIMSGREAKSERNQRKEGLTEEEASELLRTIKFYAEEDCEPYSFSQILAFRDYAMVMLMIELGLRSSDVINLNVSDFDFSLNDRVLTFVVQKNKDKKTMVVSEELADALMLYWDLRKTDNDIAFSTHSGARMANNNMNERLGRYAKMAGIDKPVTCHILRHTCGALVYSHSNGDIMLTKEVLGHKSIAVTQIYAYNEEISSNIAEKTSNVTKKLMANF